MGTSSLSKIKMYLLFFTAYSLLREVRWRKILEYFAGCCQSATFYLPVCQTVWPYVCPLLKNVHFTDFIQCSVNSELMFQHVQLKCTVKSEDKPRFHVNHILVTSGLFQMLLYTSLVRTVCLNPYLKNKSRLHTGFKMGNVFLSWRWDHFQTHHCYNEFLQETQLNVSCVALLPKTYSIFWDLANTSQCTTAVLLTELAKVAKCLRIL